jgi:hypothetical protein
MAFPQFSINEAIERHYRALNKRPSATRPSSPALAVGLDPDDEWLR